MFLIKLLVRNSHSHPYTILNLENGVNWIKGENESGKSELLDLIAFALFGKGLRSKDNLKSLEVKLFFRIKETYYTVERSNKVILNKIIYSDNQMTTKQITSGISATNKAITERLGYDYSVYQVLNYSTQLNALSLTSKYESERLKLINKINGVDEATSFEKYLESLKKEIKAQLKVLDLPSDLDFSFTENPTYEKYLQPVLWDKLNSSILSLTNSLTKLESLSSNLSISNTPLKKVDKELEKLLQKYPNLSTDIVEYYNLYSSLKSKIQENIEYIDKHFILDKKISKEQLKEYEEVVAHNLQYNRQQELLKKSIHCPKCSHTFLLSGSLGEILQPKIEPFCSDLYKLYYDYYNRVEKELETRRSLDDKYNNDLQLLKEKYSYIVENDFDLSTLSKINELVSNIEHNKQVTETTNKILTTYSYSSIEDAKLVCEEIPELRSNLTELLDLKENVIAYKANKNTYQTTEKAFKLTKDRIDKLTQDLKDVEEILSKSKEYRLDIQNKCIPLLNSIASKTINKLTGGKRYSLLLDEKFNLFLDGKPVEVYSGSTLVLANVALRISLIEMFYKNTFPVFIGDEIDAYADDTRAQHIHEAFNTLAENGYQLLVISHNSSIEFTGNIINLSEIKQ